MEGGFDALRHWPHAVACLGKPPKHQLERLATCSRPVVFCLDGDAWEEGYAAYMTLLTWGKADCGCVVFAPGEDPDTTPPAILAEAAKRALEVDFPVSVDTPTTQPA